MSAEKSGVVAVMPKLGVLDDELMESGFPSLSVYSECASKVAEEVKVIGYTKATIGGEKCKGNGHHHVLMSSVGVP